MAQVTAVWSSFRKRIALNASKNLMEVKLLRDIRPPFISDVHVIETYAPVHCIRPIPARPPYNKSPATVYRPM